MKTETRFIEIRASDEGNELGGIAVSYRDTAKIPGIGPERFMPGAFGPVEYLDVLLNRQHTRNVPLARTGGGGLVLTDGPDELRFDATMPDTEAARDTLTLVRQKVLRGASVEFRAVKERMQDGVRLIERASLRAIAIVDSAAYSQSVIEAREDEDAEAGQEDQMRPWEWS